MFVTTFDVSQLGKGDPLERKRSPNKPFGVHTTIRSDFFVGNSDPIGPSIVNVVNELSICYAAANMAGALHGHVIDLLLRIAPFITTLPPRKLDGGAGSGLSGQNLHKLELVLEGELDRGVSGKSSVKSVHGSQHSRNIVRHNGVVNGGGVRSRPTGGPMVSEGRPGSSLKSSLHDLDTLIKVPHDHITLSKRAMFLRYAVNALGGAGKVSTVSIEGSDLDLTNVLHLYADGNVLMNGLRGMGKGGDREALGPNKADSPTRVPVTGGVGKAKEPLQPEGFKVPLSLINAGNGVEFVLLNRKDGEFPKLFVVQRTDARTPAGYVRRNHQKMLTLLTFPREALSMIPHPKNTHNVDEQFCRARFTMLLDLSSSAVGPVLAPLAPRGKK